jgi:hypothetical protein
MICRTWANVSQKSSGPECNSFCIFQPDQDNHDSSGTAGIFSFYPTTMFSRRKKIASIWTLLSAGVLPLTNNDAKIETGGHLF